MVSIRDEPMEKMTLMLQFEDEATPFAYQVCKQTYFCFNFLEVMILPQDSKAYWIDSINSTETSIQKELKEKQQRDRQTQILREGNQEQRSSSARSLASTLLT